MYCTNEIKFKLIKEPFVYFENYLEFFSKYFKKLLQAAYQKLTSVGNVYLKCILLDRKINIKYRETYLLTCQPRVTVTTYFVYKVIRDLESIDRLCINPIRRINTQVIYRLALAQVECTS